MDYRTVKEVFSPKEYADLVEQTDAIFQSGQSAEAVIQALANKIAIALQKDEQKRRKQTQLEGIAAARARGVHLGRPRIQPPANFPLVLKQYLDGNLTANVAAGLCGVAVSTFYRMKRDVMEQELPQQAEPGSQG